jgi:hypothetical protein
MKYIFIYLLLISTYAVGQTKTDTTSVKRPINGYNLFIQGIVTDRTVPTKIDNAYTIMVQGHKKTYMYIQTIKQRKPVCDTVILDSLNSIRVLVDSFISKSKNEQTMRQMMKLVHSWEFRTTQDKKKFDSLAVTLDKKGAFMPLYYTKP